MFPNHGSVRIHYWTHAWYCIFMIGWLRLINIARGGCVFLFYMFACKQNQKVKDPLFFHPTSGNSNYLWHCNSARGNSVPWCWVGSHKLCWSSGVFGETAVGTFFLTSCVSEVSYWTAPTNLKYQLPPVWISLERVLLKICWLKTTSFKHLGKEGFVQMAMKNHTGQKMASEHDNETSHHNNTQKWWKLFACLWTASLKVLCSLRIERKLSTILAQL